MADHRLRNPKHIAVAHRINTIREKLSPGEKLVRLGIYVFLAGMLLAIGGGVLWVILGSWLGFGLFLLCGLVGFFVSIGGIFMMTAHP